MQLVGVHGEPAHIERPVHGLAGDLAQFGQIVPVLHPGANDPAGRPPFIVISDDGLRHLLFTRPSGQAVIAHTGQGGVSALGIERQDVAA